MTRTIILILAGWLLLSASPLAAGVIFYVNDKPGWEAATGGTYRTEDFADATLNPGLTFQSTTDRGSVTPPVFSDWVSAGEGYTHWFFDRPITGFGGDWDLSVRGPGTGVTFLIVLADETEIRLETDIRSSFSGEFFGFVSDDPIVRVTYSGGGESGAGDPANLDFDYWEETLTLDNLVYAAPAAGEVPEPGTCLLGGGAITLLAVLRRRRQRRCGS